MGAFLFKASFVWLTNAIFNLLPILDLDGYFLLVDYLEMPALRTNALAYVREALLPQLRARIPLTPRGDHLHAVRPRLRPPCRADPDRDPGGARPALRKLARGALDEPGAAGRLLAIGWPSSCSGRPCSRSWPRSAQTALAMVALLACAGGPAVRGDVPREYLEALADLPFLARRATLASSARSRSHPVRAEDVEAGQRRSSGRAPGDRFYLVLRRHRSRRSIAARTAQVSLWRRSGPATTSARPRWSRTCPAPRRSSPRRRPAC